MSEKTSIKPWEQDKPDSPEKESDKLSTRTISGRPPAKPDLSTRQVAGKARSRVEGRLTKDTLLQGRYRIMGVIGAGGMSTVYKAQDMRFPKVTRLCAAKEMLNTSSDPHIRERNLNNFEREASILATLSHPAIPQVYDYFTEGDHSYLIQEFIKGRDLEEMLNTIDTFPPESQVVSWALQTCDVLVYLHSYKPHPIVFRDVKPSNIMLDEYNRVRLVDFGIAKVFQSGLKGTMIGTEGYSPPEQYRGIADPRGDIYALGATMHHLLSRQDPRLEPPFSFHERPIHAANPNVSDELVTIISQALEYDIEKRFSSVETLREALSKLPSARGAVSASLIGSTSDLRAPGEPKPLWDFTCEDEIRSSPAVAYDTVYVGVYDHNLYALEARTGKFLWKYPTEGGIGSSPYVFEGLVLVGSQDQSLYAISAQSGSIRWTCPTGGPIYSSPKAQLGLVFFGSDDNKLYALKASSGRVAWTLQTESPVRSSPTLGQSTIYVGNESGSFYAVNAGGKIIWRFRARRGITSSALMVGDNLYVGSKDGFFYTLDVDNGWDVWRYRCNGPVISSPATDGTYVFFGSVDGDVYAVNMASGRLGWRYSTEGQVTSSPAVHQGAVYVGSTDGYLYSLDADKGKLRWRFKTEGPIISSPCIVDNTLYIGSSDHHVYALPL
ncbi:MAG: PQQ-binding-like beta-propeller repeat protein [Anaerolineae bacterium]|nr:PQQ-binding-like beta-propeller repeat protein [Anaerolineae bacterium]